MHHWILKHITWSDFLQVHWHILVQYKKIVCSMLLAALYMTTFSYRRITGYGFFVIGCGYFLSTELTSSEGYLFTPTPISCEDVSDYNAKAHQC